MSRRVIEVILMGTLVGLICLGFDWALRPLINPGPTGLISLNYPSDFAHFIATEYTHHLINPAWVGAGYIQYWGPTESAARFAVVALGTLGLFLLLHVAMARSLAGLRPNLPVLLLPSVVATGMMASMLIFMNSGQRLAPHVHLALLISPLMFVFLTVIQYLALRLARGERQRLVRVYAVGALVFAGSYSLVSCLLRMRPPPPNTVYIGGPAEVAFGAFWIVGIFSLLYLTPMLVTSWLLLRRKAPCEPDLFSTPLKPVS